MISPVSRPQVWFSPGELTESDHDDDDRKRAGAAPTIQLVEHAAGLAFGELMEVCGGKDINSTKALVNAGDHFAHKFRFIPIAPGVMKNHFFDQLPLNIDEKYSGLLGGNARDGKNHM